MILSVINSRPTTSSRPSNLLAYLDVDLGPPVPAGTPGDELSPSSTITSNTSGLLDVTATDTHCLHIFPKMSPRVRFGLPSLLLPPSGIQSIAGLEIGRRRICPINLLRLSATMSIRSSTPARAREVIIILFDLLANSRLICSMCLIIITNHSE